MEILLANDYFKKMNSNLNFIKNLYRAGRTSLSSLLSFPPVYYSFFLGFSPSLNLALNRVACGLFSAIAPFHPRLGVSYVSSNDISSLSAFSKVSLSELEAKSLSELVKKARTYGASFLSPALGTASAALLNAEIQDSPLGNKLPFGEGVICTNMVLKAPVSELNDLISQISFELLGKQCKPTKQAYQLLEFVGKADVRDTNTTQHIDRYLPCLKMFYFPEAVSSLQSPFGYVPYSHLIDHDYLKSIDSTYCNIARGRKFIAPFSIRRKVSLPPEVRFAVPSNTLVVAFTNGIHRRCEFVERDEDLPRYRKSIRFIFYRSFGLFDLIIPSLVAVFGRLSSSLLIRR